MSCEKIMNEYLALDKGRWLPFHITLHMLQCKKCRAEILRLIAAEKAAAAYLTARADMNADTASVPFDLEKLFNEKTEKEINQSFKSWIVAGIIMICCFLFSSTTFMGQWCLSIFGNAYRLPLYLFFGCAITVYCALFITTHIDFFVKKFDLTEKPL